MINFQDRDSTVLFKFNTIVSVHLDPPPRPHSRHDINYWQTEGMEPPAQFFTLNIEIPNASLLLHYPTPEQRQTDFDRLLNHMGVAREL